MYSLESVGKGVCSICVCMCVCCSVEGLVCTVDSGGKGKKRSETKKRLPVLISPYRTQDSEWSSAAETPEGLKVYVCVCPDGRRGVESEA